MKTFDFDAVEKLAYQMIKKEYQAKKKEFLNTVNEEIHVEGVVAYFGYAAKVLENNGYEVDQMNIWMTEEMFNKAYGKFCKNYLRHF